MIEESFVRVWCCGVLFILGYIIEREWGNELLNLDCVWKKMFVDDNFFNLNWNVDYIISSDSLWEGGVWWLDFCRLLSLLMEFEVWLLICV